MAAEISIKREILLLVVGALISASTAFLTDSFNERREDKRMNIQKKLELNDQISKDLGKRLYLTFDLYRKRREHDSAFAGALSQYRQSKEDWNLKIYSYQSLLRYYYGQPVHEEFVSKIYNPLVDFGQKAEYDKADSTFEQEYARLRDNNVSFISKIYRFTEQ